jgi:hypothetical protein
MIRILIVGLACIVGVAVVWLFVPTAQFAPASTNATESATSSKTVGSPGISPEKRRTRAEQLVGDSLIYISRDEKRSVGWFRQQDEHVLERAMDECYLLTDPDLYLQHVEELADDVDIANVETDPASVIEKFRPTFTQLSSCANARIVYGELH